jgi:hypothetical protein
MRTHPSPDRMALSHRAHRNGNLLDIAARW